MSLGTSPILAAAASDDLAAVRWLVERERIPVDLVGDWCVRDPRIGATTRPTRRADPPGMPPPPRRFPDRPWFARGRFPVFSARLLFPIPTFGRSARAPPRSALRASRAPPDTSPFARSPSPLLPSRSFVSDPPSARASPPAPARPAFGRRLFFTRLRDRFVPESMGAPVGQRLASRSASRPLWWRR